MTEEESMDDEVQDAGVQDAEQHGFAEYTAEELLEQAQSNAQALILATALFLHQKGISLDEWTTSLGNTFALAWNDAQGWEAGEFLDAMLTNLRSLGATVLSSQLGIDHAEAAITDFPDPSLCEFLSIDPALALRYNDAAKVIAAKVGLEWEWKRVRDRLHFVVRRAGA
jgi:hypothetical protein